MANSGVDVFCQSLSVSRIDLERSIGISLCWYFAGARVSCLKAHRTANVDSSDWFPFPFYFEASARQRMSSRAKMISSSEWGESMTGSSELFSECAREDFLQNEF